MVLNLYVNYFQPTDLPSLARVSSIPQMSQSLMSTSHSTVDHTGVEERLRMEEEMNSSLLYMHEVRDWIYCEINDLHLSCRNFRL